MKVQFRLSVALPLMAIVLIFGGLAITLVSVGSDGRSAMLQRSKSDLRAQGEALARLVQRNLDDNRADVAADLSMAATDPRIDQLLVVGADGRVELAHRLAWQGRPVTEVIPDFDMESFKRVTGQQRSDLQSHDGDHALTVMTPYRLRSQAGEIRGRNQGVVYIRFDLNYEFDALHRKVVWRMAPQLLVGMLVLLALALVWSLLLLRRVMC